VQATVGAPTVVGVAPGSTTSANAQRAAVVQAKQQQQESAPAPASDQAPELKNMTPNEFLPHCIEKAFKEAAVNFGKAKWIKKNSKKTKKSAGKSECFLHFCARVRRKSLAVVCRALHRIRPSFDPAASRLLESAAKFGNGIVMQALSGMDPNEWVRTMCHAFSCSGHYRVPR